MQPILHVLKSKLAFVFALCLLATFNVKAVVNEDSCWAHMLAIPDHNDPMTMHFNFDGTVPAGSFQFLGVWDFGDGYTSNDSCPVHTYAQPGTYIVCLEFSICIGGGLSCHDDTCVTITIGNFSAIENLDGNLHNFYFYPNPVKSSFQIRSDASHELELRMKDATGREIYLGFVRNDDLIDISTLPAGMYIIEASDGKSIIQRKMIVQK